MSFDPEAPGAAGQGTEGTPASGQGDFDYAQAYNSLRPEYTRTTQALSEYEQLFEALQDPERQAQALEALGLELAAEGSPGTPADDDFVDPLEQELAALRGEVTDLRSAREQEESAAQQAEAIELRDNYIGDYLDYLEAQPGVGKFSDREEEVLGNLAIAMADEQGVPDVQGAYERIYGSDGVLESRRSQWIESKTGAYTAPLGTSIPADKKPQTRHDRVAFIDERMRALNDER